MELILLGAYNFLFYIHLTKYYLLILLYDKGGIIDDQKTKDEKTMKYTKHFISYLLICFMLTSMLFATTASAENIGLNGIKNI